MWSIYQLPGSAFPVLSWEGSLQKLALLRNDVAHGNLAIEEIFAQPGRSLVEIRAYVNDIGMFAMSFVEAWERYLSEQAYLVA